MRLTFNIEDFYNDEISRALWKANALLPSTSSRRLVKCGQTALAETLTDNPTVNLEVVCWSVDQNFHLTYSLSLSSSYSWKRRYILRTFVRRLHISHSVFLLRSLKHIKENNRTYDVLSSAWKIYCTNCPSDLSSFIVITLLRELSLGSL